MPIYDSSNSTCHVLTEKEGVLAAMAHDLKIEVTKYHIRVAEDGASWVGEFDARSLRVACAMVGGAEAPGLLKPADKRKIEKNVVSDVLHARRYPRVVFRSDALDIHKPGARVQGVLELHGSRRPLTLDVERVSAGWVVTGRLHQPDFGIKPFRAMMGALRVKAHVVVRLCVPVA